MTATTFNDLFPSKWLKASDLEGDSTMTIKKVEIEEVGLEQEEKPVVYFNETEKGLILNVTNGRSIRSHYGQQIANWIGRQVTLYSTQVDAFGETHDAIRIRT